MSVAIPVAAVNPLKNGGWLRCPKPVYCPGHHALVSGAWTTVPVTRFSAPSGSGPAWGLLHRLLKKSFSGSEGDKLKHVPHGISTTCGQTWGELQLAHTQTEVRATVPTLCFKSINREGRKETLRKNI